MNSLINLASICCHWSYYLENVTKSIRLNDSVQAASKLWPPCKLLSYLFIILHPISSQNKERVNKTSTSETLKREAFINAYTWGKIGQNSRIHFLGQSIQTFRMIFWSTSFIQQKERKKESWKVMNILAGIIGVPPNFCLKPWNIKCQTGYKSRDIVNNVIKRVCLKSCHFLRSVF